ncbi:MAG: hypothetical protein Q4D62_11840 [Planctomycetia bacterium]|nr:hypothetical protein [Planctomycetia bacterium]
MAENNETIDLEQIAKGLASGGVASQSTSVDGVSMTKTMMDALKPLDVADRLDARRAGKNPKSQIRFLKLKD